MTDTRPPIIKTKSARNTNRIPKQDSAQKTTQQQHQQHTEGYSTYLNTAKDKANSVVHSAREWLTPPSVEWSSIAQLESLSTVMFSPLAAHPVYRSESMVKAMQLMQQQQQQNKSSSNSSSPASTKSATSIALMQQRNDLVLHGKVYAWPSSQLLLQADIPESTSPVSLFQGFSHAYPSFAMNKKKKNGGGGSNTSSPKKVRRKKNMLPMQGSDKDSPKSLTQIISEREKRMRDYDKLCMQKSSTANEMDQINLQINELLNTQKELEQKWEKLESKDLQLQLIIEDLNEAILDIEEGGGNTRRLKSNEEEYSVPDSDYYDEEDEEDELAGQYEVGTCFKTLTGHTDDIICLDFNRPKGMLVSSSMDGTLKAWDLYRSQCLGNICESSSSGLVKCLKLNDARLLTGSADGFIKQWDLSLIPATAAAPTSNNSIHRHLDSAEDSAPNSPSLTATTHGSTSGLIQETFSLEGHASGITALDADQDYVVSGSADKTIKQWDLETRQCVLTLDVLWASKTSGGGNMDAWLDNAASINYGYAAHDFVGALQFWESALASGTSDGKLRMWDLRTGQAHRTLAGHKAPITCLQFDEVHLVSGSLDKTIKIWDLRTGSVFDTLNYTSPVSSLQFDSAKIISSGTSNTIDVYNRTSFQHTPLVGHKDYINSVGFHNNVLASGGSDRVIKLWSL